MRNHSFQVPRGSAILARGDYSAPGRVKSSNPPKATYVGMVLVAGALVACGSEAPPIQPELALHQALAAVEVTPGLTAEFFDFAENLSTLPDVSGLTPSVSRVDSSINYASTNEAWPGLPSAMADTFSSRHSGRLRVPSTGTYTLYLNSDDGSRLWLDGNLVVNNDGLHGMQEASAQATLAAGDHDLRVEFFENGGGAGLVVSWSGPNLSKEVIPASALFHASGTEGGPVQYERCADEGGRCTFSGTALIHYGTDTVYFERSLTDGTDCNNGVFGDPLFGTFKHCYKPVASSTAGTPVTGGTPATGTPSTNALSFTQSEYETAVKFDYEGEHGHNPAGGPGIGYPCGVPNGYSWKFRTDPLLTDLLGKSAGYNPPRYAGAGYDQIYNACSAGNPRKSMPNARVELSDIVVDFFSVRQNKWVRAVKQTSTGGAFAEDFVNNEATGADFRDETDGHKSVRSGIGNAEPRGTAGAGGRVPSMRTVDDSEVGYNYHGFGNRFEVDWNDVKAIVVAQAMRCIPQTGTDLSDCNKLGYLGQVGLDSWRATNSPYDNFQTHGGVNGGVFKPVTTGWQVFTSYSGPRDFSGITPPPVPQF